MANNNDDTPTAALLSNSQREWLADGAPDPESAAHRSLRMRIRKRVVQSFVDFTFLENLPDDDLGQVFRDPSREQVDGMIAALSLIHGGTHRRVRYGGNWSQFSALLRQAIAQSVAGADETIPHAGYVNVRFDNNEINITLSEGAVDLDRIGEKIAAGETADLDREQLSWFVDYYRRSGELDPDVPAEHRQNEWEMLQQLREDRAESDDADESGQ